MISFDLTENKSFEDHMLHPATRGEYTSFGLTLIEVSYF